MIFALAGHLGRTVAELEATMDAEEFAEWALLLGIEPWGGARLDCLAALMQHASLAPWVRGNMNVSDLIPKWGGRENTAGGFDAAAAAFLSKAKGVVSGR